MPRPKSLPKYARHSSGQARCRIDGKVHYLGQYGSAESKQRYAELIKRWSLQGDDDDSHSWDITVGELAMLYFEHAQQHYQKGGRQTSEVSCLRIALKPLAEMYRDEPASRFSPRKLKAVRQRFLEADYVRTSINLNVGRIVRMFKWAVAEEYVDVSTYQTLRTVEGLRFGRTDAKESKPVKPVPLEFVDAVKAHVSRQIWGMIQLQLLTGMRPGEAMQMRGCDLNTTGRIWEYVPESHKTQHHGKERIIFIGPKAQQVLHEFLKPNLNAYLFSPRESREEFEAANYPNRKKSTSSRYGEQYSRHSYQGAIRRACIRAKIPHWHPHQLRHNAATMMRREFGIEAAQVVLGHANLTVTEVYAERDEKAAREIIARVG